MTRGPWQLPDLCTVRCSSRWGPSAPSWPSPPGRRPGRRRCCLSLTVSVVQCLYSARIIATLTPNLFDIECCLMNKQNFWSLNPDWSRQLTCVAVACSLTVITIQYNSHHEGWRKCQSWEIVGTQTDGDLCRRKAWWSASLFGPFSATSTQMISTDYKVGWQSYISKTKLIILPSQPSCSMFTSR